jgi:hypothetical protein
VPVPATTLNNEQIAGQHSGEHRNRFVFGYVAYAALFTRTARKTSSTFFQKMFRSEVRTCARLLSKWVSLGCQVGHLAATWIAYGTDGFDLGLPSPQAGCRRQKRGAACGRPRSAARLRNALVSI